MGDTMLVHVVQRALGLLAMTELRRCEDNRNELHKYKDINVSYIHTFRLYEPLLIRLGQITRLCFPILPQILLYCLCDGDLDKLYITRLNIRGRYGSFSCRMAASAGGLHERLASPMEG